MDELEIMLDKQRQNITDYDEVKHIRFNNICEKFTVQEGKREFIATITTNDVDRDGDIVEPGGIDLKHFKDNPVIFFNHSSYDLPIGKALWLKRFNSDGRSGLVGKGRISGGTDKANDVFALMQDGILTTTSIGFGVKESREPTDEEIKSAPNLRRVITKSQLFEFSIVGIPANTSATIEAVSKMPAWMQEETEAKLEIIEEEEQHTELTDVVKLQEPVDLEELVDLGDDLGPTREEIAQKATEDAVEIHEVKVLGRVT
jgi:HK97 family phage prohead protease